MAHWQQRNRRRRIIGLGGAGDLDAVIKSSNGWLVDWLLQETSGSVAGARNRAMTAPETRNVALLTYADYTAVGAGWSDLGSEVARCDGSQLANTVFSQPLAFLRAGTTWQATFTISNYGGGNVRFLYGGNGLGTARSADGTYVETKEYVPGAIIGFLANVDFIGDIDLKTVLFEQTDIAASSQGLGLLDGTHSGTEVGVAGNGRGIRYAARYDGATTYTDISGDVNSMFSLDRGSANIWFRVSGAGVWIDGVQRNLLTFKTTSGTGLLFIRKSTVNNTIDTFQKAGGVQVGVPITISSLEFNMVTLTWDNDVAVDEYKVYLNAVQQGATQTGLGTQVENLSSTEVIIGAANTTPANVWDGDIAYVSLNDQELTQSEITAQYQAGN